MGGEGREGGNARNFGRAKKPSTGKDDRNVRGINLGYFFLPFSEVATQCGVSVRPSVGRLWKNKEAKRVRYSHPPITTHSGHSTGRHVRTFKY